MICSHCGLDVTRTRLIGNARICTKCEDFYVLETYPAVTDCLSVLEEIESMRDSVAWPGIFKSVLHIASSDQKPQVIKFQKQLNWIMGGHLSMAIEKNLNLATPTLLNQLKEFKKKIKPILRLALKFRIDHVRDRILSLHHFPDFSISILPSSPSANPHDSSPAQDDGKCVQPEMCDLKKTSLEELRNNVEEEKKTPSQLPPQPQPQVASTP